MKGAALAGCLQETLDRKIDIQGYGGTSAGSIVALLACVGYTGNEINGLLGGEIHPIKLLKDDGKEFERVKYVAREASKIAGNGLSIGSIFDAIRCYWNHGRFIGEIVSGLGLDDGEVLKAKVLELVRQKLPQLKAHEDITFGDLQKANCKPLKIVASNIGNRRADVFSYEEDPSASVITAIRASSSYPVLFKPVDQGDANVFVDGGLSSNLPAFLFSREHEKNQLPTIAFDLVAQNKANPRTSIGFANLMLDTALEASDGIIGKMIDGLHYVRIRVPANISTLNFNLSVGDIEALFNAGKAGASTSFNGWRKLTLSQQACETIQKELQAFYGDKKLYEPLLWAFAESVKRHSNAEGVRCHIMLPTGRANGNRIIVYHYGFRDDDQDRELELAEFGGCSGRAFLRKQPSVADLNKAAENHETEWNMTSTEQRKIPKDRQSMLSVPIFAEIDANFEEGFDVPIRGVLSIDSSTPLNDSGWLDYDADDNVQGVTKRVTALAIQWAAIISKVMR